MERLDKSIRSELERVAPAGGGGERGGLVAAVHAWPAAVGETVARNAWPARLGRDGVLLVHASSSTWAFELGRMAAEILDQLRAVLGDAAPRALKFVPGRVPEAAAESAERAAPAPAEIAPEDAAAGADLAAPIEDEELRSAVARAAAASLANARREAASDRRF